MSPPSSTTTTATAMAAVLMCTFSPLAALADGSGLVKMAFPEVRSQATGDLVLPWKGQTIKDLHNEYGQIFKHGNRNAASHLWSTFLIERAVFLTEATFLEIASGYCAVSGSPVSPRGGTRYKMRLDRVDGTGRETGFMYYCCWPCVCDTQDFIRVDTKTIRTQDGGERQYSVAVIGNPCDHEEKLSEPFIQPFDKRETTILRDAREVRCGSGGELVGATLSDHGYIIISLFFNATGAGTEHQDEGTFAEYCSDRAANGYNSGMGEIFRRVAAISPVQIQSSNALPDLSSGAGAGDPRSVTAVDVEQSGGDGRQQGAKSPESKDEL